MGIFGRLPEASSGRSVNHHIRPRLASVQAVIGLLSGLLPAGTIVTQPVLAATTTTTIHLLWPSIQSAPSATMQGPAA